jgi:site-specific recombinase XerD
VSVIAPNRYHQPADERQRYLPNDERRLKDAGLPIEYSPHSFRVATITDLREQDQAIEDVQYLVGYADPRTTRLYDRRCVRRNPEVGKRPIG